MYTEEVKINRIIRDSSSLIDDEVARDVPICIFLNDEPFKTLIASPGKYKELAVGHIFSEGVISGLDDIKNIDLFKERINMKISKEIEPTISELRKIRLITTACGSRGISNYHELESLKLAKSRTFSSDTILESIKKLNELGQVFRKTGATHSALLLSKKNSYLGHAEDVGRHNAVDKVIGEGLLSGVDFWECILSTSGRLSGEMVLKAAYAQIPVVCSVSAPLLSGITIAQKTGITLYGFVRGKRMNQYTGQDQIIP
jgi:FdhD protein